LDGRLWAVEWRVDVWRREESLALTGIWTLERPTRTLVAVPTAPFLLPLLVKLSDIKCKENPFERCWVVVWCQTDSHIEKLAVAYCSLNTVEARGTIQQKPFGVNTVLWLTSNL
jgi:hypothetical protein